MKICIPVNDPRGLESTVCAHFGSAPGFCLVDTDTREVRVMANQNDHHAHGMCRPLDAFRGEHLDAMVVGGIGQGAIYKLEAAGVAVYRAQHATVRETIDAFVAGTLERVNPAAACSGHGGHHDH